MNLFHRQSIQADLLLAVHTFFPGVYVRQHLKIGAYSPLFCRHKIGTQKAEECSEKSTKFPNLFILNR